MTPILIFTCLTLASRTPETVSSSVVSASHQDHKSHAKSQNEAAKKRKAKSKVGHSSGAGQVVQAQDDALRRDANRMTEAWLAKINTHWKPIERLFAEGRLEEVYEACDVALRDVPSNLWVQYQADVRMKQGRWQDAYNILGPIRNVDLEFHARLNVVASKLGRYEEVNLQECIDRVLSFFDRNWAPEVYIPTHRSESGHVFLTSLSFVRALGEDHYMSAFFLRQAENEFPDNPILGEFFYRHMVGRHSSSIVLPYVTRCIPNIAPGRFKDSFLRLERNLKADTEKQRLSGG